MVLLKENLKVRVAAYKEAMEEAAMGEAEAAENAAPGGPGGPVVIEPDDDESESHDEGVYAAFEEAIKAEDHKAYIEAL
ncbi:uncharacterized protein K441DRAFT_668720 [Cenococcum geophilum 1.58]|uniref:uncharacterized protein n=1 Tax=Cenococcum geophilum 1.58 TaxID=794803 RepID=UPI00358FDAEB|nr:hypothetical protein K441DRAFT_668720 [Cenococcum geophilum 1.58]